MSHDGKKVLCGQRMHTIVAADADEEVDCWECYEAMSFN